MNQIICSERITKCYGAGDEKQTVLNDVSVDIGENEFISIMGPSGSGKSTLLFAVSGMDNVDSGNIYFAGKNLTAFTEAELAELRRTEMGFIFQQPTMLKNLSLIDNMILPVVRNHRKGIADITKKAEALMERMGILELAGRDITQVSGGQLQRAGICRALMSSPRIIFADEPTGALNSKSAEGIMDILNEIHAAGTAIMLVTHDAKVAARTERILFMHDGKIASELFLGKCSYDTIEQRKSVIMEKMREIGI